jgi:hypothetical protein
VALTAVRGGTLRLARWEQMLELDGSDARWHIPAYQMKGEQGKQREFTVPLCRQAVETLAPCERSAVTFRWFFLARGIPIALSQKIASFIFFIGRVSRDATLSMAGAPLFRLS